MTQYTPNLRFRGHWNKHNLQNTFFKDTHFMNSSLYVVPCEFRITAFEVAC